MRPAKWSHWNDDERRELAVYIKKAIDKNAKINVACAIAAKKMSRTKGACEFQYQKYLKHNLQYYLTPVETEEKVDEVLEQEEVVDNVGDDQPQEEAKAKVDWDTPQLPQPTIQVYGNFGEPELAEIISHTSDMIIARARGLFFTIKL